MGTAPEGNQMSKAVVKWTRATLVEVADKDTYTREEMDEVLLQGVAFVNGLSKAIEDRVYDQYGQSGLADKTVNAIRDVVEVENERQYRLHPISVNDAMGQHVNDLVSELGLLSADDLDGKDFISESDVDTKIEEATSGFVSLEDMSETAESLNGRISIVETSLAMQNEELRNNIAEIKNSAIELCAQNDELHSQTEDLRNRVASLEKMIIRLSANL